MVPVPVKPFKQTEPHCVVQVPRGKGMIRVEMIEYVNDLNLTLIKIFGALTLLQHLDLSTFRSKLIIIINYFSLLPFR